MYISLFVFNSNYQLRITGTNASTRIITHCGGVSKLIPNSLSLRIGTKISDNYKIAFKQNTKTSVLLNRIFLNSDSVFDFKLKAWRDCSKLNVIKAIVFA